MCRFRISLYGLIAVLTVLALWLGILVNANETLWRIARNITCLTLVGSAAYAMAVSSKRRAVVGAFLLCTWSYLLFHYGICNMENDARTLVTTHVLNIIWSAIRVENPEFDPQLAMSGATPAYTPEWSYFVDIGVMLVAVLCGLCGASIVAITWEVVPPLGVSPKEQ